VLACEFHDNVETKAIVDKAIVACGVFSSVQGHSALRMMRNLLKKICFGSSS